MIVLLAATLLPAAAPAGPLLPMNLTATLITQDSRVDQPVYIDVALEDIDGARIRECFRFGDNTGLICTHTFYAYCPPLPFMASYSERLDHIYRSPGTYTFTIQAVTQTACLEPLSETRTVEVTVSVRA